jgi:hypothetical protein
MQQNKKPVQEEGLETRHRPCAEVICGVRLLAIPSCNIPKMPGIMFWWHKRGREETYAHEIEDTRTCSNPILHYGTVHIDQHRIAYERIRIFDLCIVVLRILVVTPLQVCIPSHKVVRLATKFRNSLFWGTTFSKTFYFGKGSNVRSIQRGKSNRLYNSWIS